MFCRAVAAASRMFGVSLREEDLISRPHSKKSPLQGTNSPLSGSSTRSSGPRRLGEPSDVDSVPQGSQGVPLLNLTPQTQQSAETAPTTTKVPSRAMTTVNYLSSLAQQDLSSNSFFPSVHETLYTADPTPTPPLPPNAAPVAHNVQMSPFHSDDAAAIRSLQEVIDANSHASHAALATPNSDSLVPAPDMVMGTPNSAYHAAQLAGVGVAAEMLARRRYKTKLCNHWVRTGGFCPRCVC